MAFSGTKIGIKFIKEKYGVDIDLSHYLKQTKKLAPNGVLIGMFREAYKQIHLKDTLDMTGESKKCAEFFKDFNYHVVLNLRADAPLKRLNVPDREFGFSPKEQYDFIKRLNDNGPKNNIEAVMMNYEKGNIRIRDMKYFATHINEFGGLRNEKNRTILATYAEALKRVNASRTTGWRWRHPWRNNAETRDAKIIEDILKNGVGDRLYTDALNSAKTTLFAGDRIEKACLKSTLNVEKIDDYVEVEPDPNAPKLEDWEVRQAEWKKFLSDQEKQREEEERARKEAILKQQEKEKQDALRREQEKENIKKQREEEKRLKEEKIKNNPDAAKSPEEIAKEAQDEINNFLAKLKADIKKREDERNQMSTHISVDDLKENIYANNEENSKIEEPSIENPSLGKNI